MYSKNKIYYSCFHILIEDFILYFVCVYIGYSFRVDSVFIF